jgi:hypothetical protein
VEPGRPQRRLITFHPTLGIVLAVRLIDIFFFSPKSKPKGNLDEAAYCSRILMEHSGIYVRIAAEAAKIHFLGIVAYESVNNWDATMNPPKQSASGSLMASLA